uniref:Hexosyltransferase n=1 Tax=Ciona intestinalis TaxID=7719 RepID=H2Y2P7_CIOIN
LLTLPNYLKTHLRNMLTQHFFLLVSIIWYNCDRDSRRFRIPVNWKVLLSYYNLFTTNRLTTYTDFPIREESYKYVFKNEEICKKKPPYLVIFVKSSPQNVAQRNAIRQTWGDIAGWKMKMNHEIIIAFMVGWTNQSNSDLTKENAVYGDVVQKDFVDTFNNLTIKLVSQLNWMTRFCRYSKFFMTTDDDVFVHVPNLLQFLENTSETIIYTGCVFSGSAPNRNKESKYYVPYSSYPGLFFPSYCAGAGYILSNTLVTKLFKQSELIPALYIDDAYVGILAKSVNCVPQHNAKFT